MEKLERKSHLLLGLILAIVPAVLFLPALMMLMIYYPGCGNPWLWVVGAVFLCSETVAIRKLMQARTGRFDWINLLSTLGTVLAALVILATIGGVRAGCFRNLG